MQEKDFVSYEYRTVSVKAKDQARVMDLYEAFGWEVTGTSPALDGVTLSLKRDRHIPHKQELVKLERQAEDTFARIGGLERSKTQGASAFSYIFGCIAALILGGGMSLVMLVEGSIPALVGGIVLGIIGIVLCGVNYPIYKRLASQKTKALLPVIDETEEKLANLLERGNELLSAERI
ncbi:MAG TPA: hypothetical protein H9964_06150 [Candidatus Gallimonas intestinavium]|uniref:DUF2812 domain-containing protein n=1 Tax=Candidatus Gallimonas intestinavium TaxID=2838603 RepID=A0A9D2G5T1_9FIRM|nr:hypothetical protein [Candidatus Gallimonas intestinavium]